MFSKFRLTKKKRAQVVAQPPLQGTGIFSGPTTRVEAVTPSPPSLKPPKSFLRAPGVGALGSKPTSPLVVHPTSPQVTMGSPAFYDPTTPQAEKEAQGGLADSIIEGATGFFGGVVGAMSAGADSAGSGAETAAGTSAAGDDSGVPGDSYGDNAGLSGPLANIMNELEEGAKETGLSIYEYADRLLEEYPWLGPTLGVASGAALITLLYSLGSGGDVKPPTTKKKKKAAPKKPKGWTNAEWEAWKKARGKSGPISKKEFHETVWPSMKPKKKKKKAPHKHHVHVHHTHKKKKSKSKGKKKGKRVKFTTADGEVVSFYAKG